MDAKTSKRQQSLRAIFAGALCVSAALFSACGGGGGGGGGGVTPTPAPPTPPPPPPPPPPVPPEATALASKVTTDMGRSMARVASLESGLVIFHTPGMPLAGGMTFLADTSAGAPPRRYLYSGSYDGNGDGRAESRIDGRVTFTADPADFTTGFTGAQGNLALNIEILGLMHVYEGNVAYTLGMNEHQLSGGGSFRNPMTGTTTTLTVSPSQPLRVRLADGTANARPNGCAHSFAGQAQVNIAGSGGTLASQWRFAFDRSTATVTGASYTDSAGRSTALPDTEVDLGCASGASINDWNGHFRIWWACLPQEFGEFQTTITVKNATTLSMIDDGDTAAEAYEASLIGTSPRAVRGFFIDGPSGSRYREDFNWTLNLDGSGFSQTSRYVYIEGSQQGRGGICAARATRIS